MIGMINMFPMAIIIILCCLVLLLGVLLFIVGLFNIKRVGAGKKNKPLISGIICILAPIVLLIVLSFIRR